MEVVWVIVIIGILAAIAAPRFSNSIAIQRIEAAGRRIAVDLGLAQRNAMSTNANQTVQFRATPELYRLKGMPHPDHPNLEYEVLLSEEPYGVSYVSVDFGGDLDLIFDIYGIPDSGGTVVISLGSQVKTITVDAETGKASVQ